MSDETFIEERKFEPLERGFICYGDGEVQQWETPDFNNLVVQRGRIFAKALIAKKYDAIINKNYLIAQWVAHMAPSYVPDFSKRDVSKHHITFNHVSGVWMSNPSFCTEIMGVVYMPARLAGSLCKILNDGGYSLD